MIMRDKMKRTGNKMKKETKDSRQDEEITVDKAMRGNMNRNKTEG